MIQPSKLTLHAVDRLAAPGELLVSFRAPNELRDLLNIASKMTDVTVSDLTRRLLAEGVLRTMSPEGVAAEIAGRDAAHEAWREQTIANVASLIPGFTDAFVDPRNS